MGIELGGEPVVVAVAGLALVWRGAIWPGFWMLMARCWVVIRAAAGSSAPTGCCPSTGLMLGNAAALRRYDRYGSSGGIRPGHEFLRRLMVRRRCWRDHCRYWRGGKMAGGFGCRASPGPWSLALPAAGVACPRAAWSPARRWVRIGGRQPRCRAAHSKPTDPRRRVLPPTRSPRTKWHHAVRSSTADKIREEARNQFRCR